MFKLSAIYMRWRSKCLGQLNKMLFLFATLLWIQNKLFDTTDQMENKLTSCNVPLLLKEEKMFHLLFTTTHLHFIPSKLVLILQKIKHKKKKSHQNLKKKMHRISGVFFDIQLIWIYNCFRYLHWSCCIHSIWLSRLSSMKTYACLNQLVSKPPAPCYGYYAINCWVMQLP